MRGFYELSQLPACLPYLFTYLPTCPPAYLFACPWLLMTLTIVTCLLPDGLYLWVASYDVTPELITTFNKIRHSPCAIKDCFCYHFPICTHTYMYVEYYWKYLSFFYKNFQSNKITWVFITHCILLVKNGTMGIFQCAEDKMKIWYKFYKVYVNVLWCWMS